MKLKKITNEGVPARRYYADACAAAHALDLFGERWALLVMRELMMGPKRFGDIKADLPGISANVLTQRLESLEAAGVLCRRKLPPPASTQVYELTPWGYESEPIFQAMGRWAVRSPTHDPSLPFSAVSLMLSMRTMFDPSRAVGLRAKIDMVIGREAFEVTLADGELVARRGRHQAPDIVFTGPARAIGAALYSSRTIAELEEAGLLKLEGDRPLAERFSGLFPIPSRAEPPAPTS